MKITVVLSSVLFVVCLGDKEHTRHGAHSPIDEKHYDHGQHNVHYDHEAILGSRKTEDEFDELEPEESKRRLSVLVKRMDKNHDGYVCVDELLGWIMMSFKMLDEEEAGESFEEQDEDHNGHVTWIEYLNKQYNYKPEDLDDFRKEPSTEHTEILEMVDEDKLKFVAADLNKDEQLDRSEYSAFYHPYDHEHMHQVELDRVAKSSDKDKDGFITWDEYLGDRKPDEEMESWERQHFKDYDKNNDGKLDREEMKGWVLPDNKEVAQEEVTHLMEKADEDRDGKLSFDEIIDNSDTFVGSQATDYGRHLHIMKEEL